MTYIPDPRYNYIIYISRTHACLFSYNGTYVCVYACAYSHIRTSTSAQFCIFYNYNANFFYFLWRAQFHFFYQRYHYMRGLKLRFKSKYFFLAPLTKKIIQLWVGYSHVIFTFSYFLYIKYTTKRTLFIFSYDYVELWNFARWCKQLKPYDKYTFRGIRFLHDTFYRRVGKVKLYL